MTIEGPFPRLATSKERDRLSYWQERKAKEVMTENLDSGIQISVVAKECSLSRSHFSRAFKKATGHSPRDWLKLARLTRAKELLERTDSSITQVGLECGFADQSHFIRMFSRKFGITPGKWRTQQKCADRRTSPSMFGGALETIDRSEEFIKITFAVLMTSE